MSEPVTRREALAAIAAVPFVRPDEYKPLFNTAKFIQDFDLQIISAVRNPVNADCEWDVNSMHPELREKISNG